MMGRSLRIGIPDPLSLAAGMMGRSLRIGIPDPLSLAAGISPAYAHALRALK
jgi:hypothetical protein